MDEFELDDPKEPRLALMSESEAPVQRVDLPADVHRRFFGNCPTEGDLKCVSNWVLAQRMMGPDGVKFASGVWHENLLAIERTLAQKYKDMGLSDPEAQTGKAVKVYKPVGEKRKGMTSRKDFGDNADEDYDLPPGTLGEYVITRCGEDSEEWKDYLRIKGLFAKEPEKLEEADVGEDLIPF